MSPRAGALAIGLSGCSCLLVLLSSVVKGLVTASVAAIGAFLAYRVYSSPRSVRPGINAPFAAEGAGAEFLSRFETESREIFVKKQTVIDALQIPLGAHVADVGAGTGLFLESLAQAVGPAGSVYGIDPFPKFIQFMTERVSRMPADLQPRIKIVQNTDFTIGSVPAGSLDFILLIDAYHHLEYPLDIVKTFHTALKAGGQFVVLDFVRVPGVSSEWVLGHVRAGQEVVEAEIRACGFTVDKEIANQVGLTENYLLVCKKA